MTYCESRCYDQKTTPMDDAKLLTEYVQRKSNEAFRGIVDRYAGFVYGVCLQALEKPELAEDAAQAVFLILAQRSAHMKVHGSLAGWFYTTSRLVKEFGPRREPTKKPGGSVERRNGRLQHG